MKLQLSTTPSVCSLIESFSYTGILLVSFVACLRALLWSEGWFKPLRVLNVKMIVATILMFIIATLDLGFHFRRNLEAFVWNHGPATEDFKQTSRWTSVITMGTYVAQTFVGDSILVRRISRIIFWCCINNVSAFKLYRCWVIYNNNWLVVALPIVLWLGTSGKVSSSCSSFEELRVYMI